MNGWLREVGGEGLTVRQRRSTRARRPNVIVPLPLSNTHGYIQPAEPPHAPRGMTKGLTTCGGCNKKDSLPKLPVEGFPPYHPDCYGALVRTW